MKRLREKKISRFFFVQKREKYKKKLVKERNLQENFPPSNQKRNNKRNEEKKAKRLNKRCKGSDRMKTYEDAFERNFVIRFETKIN